MSSKLEEAVFGIKQKAGSKRPEAARVRAALDAIRPTLIADGGNVELEQIDPDGTVCLVFQGECRACPSLELTFRRIIEPLLCAEVPEIHSIRTQ